jgi:hypothetical protein
VTPVEGHTANGQNPVFFGRQVRGGATERPFQLDRKIGTKGEEAVGGTERNRRRPVRIEAVELPSVTAKSRTAAAKSNERRPSGEEEKVGMQISDTLRDLEHPRPDPTRLRDLSREVAESEPILQ